MTEKIYVEYEGRKLEFPRDIPLRIWRIVENMNQLAVNKTEEEAKKNWAPILEQSNKLVDAFIKWNPSHEDIIEDMDQTSAYEVFGEWAKKVQASRSGS